KYDYLFVGGRLRCGRCGESMSGFSPKQVPRYRCYTQIHHLPGEPFCHGSVRADQIEPPVWREIEGVLNNPELIMEKLTSQAAQYDATQRERAKEVQAIQKALAALEREAQRWDTAYAEEVIDLAELKAKKLDINERKQRLLAQQEAVETVMHA